MSAPEIIRLSSFSHGSGCGCKIAPARLANILKGKTTQHHAHLLVGNSSNDDAAVYKLNQEECLISTTDFFMPVVDDAYTFGKIAAVNAMSDVYAMGGKPILALAILGWPIDKLSDDLAAEVMQGGLDACAEAGIPLAGGHSIDNLEPVFGLAVNGLVRQAHLKQNSTAEVGDVIFLTKPIGTGIIATAIKRQKASQAAINLAVDAMTMPNIIGTALGAQPGVTAMTDVTGFGLAGHVLEMMKGASLTAELWYSKIPILDMTYLQPLIDAFILPDNTFRNYNSYAESISPLTGSQLPILCDPQTSGGLLITVKPSHAKAIAQLLQDHGVYSQPIGEVQQKQDKHIVVK